MRPDTVVKIGALRLTRGRLAWLRRLRDEGIATRSRGNVGFHCMRAGLTTWAWQDQATGEILDEAEKRARFSGEGRWPTPDGETLTELGREALLQADRLERKLPMTIDPAERLRLEWLNRELGIDAPIDGQPDQAFELAIRIMELTTESGQPRLVVATALWRAIAGFHARLTLDAGDGPELAGASLLETAFAAANIAEQLVTREMTTPHASADSREPEVSRGNAGA